MVGCCRLFYPLPFFSSSFSVQPVSVISAIGGSQVLDVPWLMIFVPPSALSALWTPCTLTICFPRPATSKHQVYLCWLVRSYEFSHSLETIVRIQLSMLLWCNKFSFLDAKMMDWAISLKIKYGVFSNSWLSNSNAPLVQMVPHKVLEKNETLYLSPTFLKSPALTLVEIRSLCALYKNISPPN